MCRSFVNYVSELLHSSKWMKYITFWKWITIYWTTHQMLVQSGFLLYPLHLVRLALHCFIRYFSTSYCSLLLHVSSVLLLSNHMWCCFFLFVFNYCNFVSFYLLWYLFIIINHDMKIRLKNLIYLYVFHGKHVTD